VSCDSRKLVAELFKAFINRGSTGVTPSMSAVIWLNVVSCPWPCGDEPVRTFTFPVGSMRTVADSQPPAGMALDGPIAQISTYVETPIPM
jgi:hypothetical protein